MFEYHVYFHNIYVDKKKKSTQRQSVSRILTLSSDQITEKKKEANYKEKVVFS